MKYTAERLGIDASHDAAPSGDCKTLSTAGAMAVMRRQDPGVLMSRSPRSFLLLSKWSHGPGLNRRPAVYETAALPLSYRGATEAGRLFYTVFHEIEAVRDTVDGPAARAGQPKARV